MASLRIANIEPIGLMVALGTNLLNPAAAGTGIGYTPTATYVEIRHMRVTNRTNVPVAVSLWKGASGLNIAGTEFAWAGAMVPAVGYLDWFGQARFDATDFLVGGAGAANALTLTVEGLIGLA